MKNGEKALVALSTKYAKFGRPENRPSTAGEPVATSLSKLRNRSEYLKIKHEGESSRVVLGNDRKKMEGTDYRSNFMWTVPKFAL